MIRPAIAMPLLLALLAGLATADDGSRISENVTTVLRRPLPPEDISHTVGPRHITIEGPTFAYPVNKTTGAITSLEVRREGPVVVELENAAEARLPGAGPPGLLDQVLISVGNHGVREVHVNSKPSEFLVDPTRRRVHGGVTYAEEPVTIEALRSEDVATRLPVKTIVANRLTTNLRGQRGAPRQPQSPSATSDRNESRPVPGYEWANVTGKAAFAARDGAGALVFQDKMWLIGGWNPPDKVHFPKLCNNEVWSSTDGQTWSLEKPNTFKQHDFDPDRDWEGRHTAGYVVHQEKMWIVGGDPLQGHYQNDVWNSADGRTWKCVNRNVPWSPRVLHYTVAFKDRIWIMGGQTTPQFAPAEDRFYNDIWNTSDGITWTQVTPNAPHWTVRGMIGGSVVFQDKMWILGGGTYDTPRFPTREFYNDVWSSPDGMHWTQHLEHAPWHPRQYHEVAVFDGHLWVLEGWNQTNRNDVWYSADGTTWKQLADTPWTPRHAASTFVYDNALWVVAGNNMQSDVWKLQRK